MSKSFFISKHSSLNYLPISLILFMVLFTIVMPARLAAKGLDIKYPDCSKTTNKFEIHLCTSPELYALVHKMAHNYGAKIKMAAGWEIKIIKKEQTKWYEYLATECGFGTLFSKIILVDKCLNKNYEDRITDINASYKDRIRYYRDSIQQNRFTPYERERWRRFIQWPDNCEIDDLEFMPQAGLEFIYINNSYSFLLLSCERYDTKGHYALYLIDDLDGTLKSSRFDLKQIKYAEDQLEFYNSNRLNGQFSYSLGESMTLDYVKRKPREKLCGFHSLYNIISNPSSKPDVNLIRVRVNQDCNREIRVEDWPTIDMNSVVKNRASP